MKYKKMKMNGNLILIFVLAFSLFLIISPAFIITSPNYKMIGVISGGGGNATGRYVLEVAAGQPFVGVTTGSHEICFGLFCIITAGKNFMNFTGYLNYSTGEPVKNSLIEITLKNETIGFEKSGTDKTDDVGYFSVRIEPIPPNAMKSNLNISIRVIGDVEAIYECWYNSSSENCCPYPLTQPC